VLFALTRQGLKGLTRPGDFELEDVWKGAYRLREPGRSADVVLVASGSEVSLAWDAAEELATQGVEARIVSMPSLERFNAQSEADQLALVPDDGTPVVAIEAGRGESYRGLVGRRGLVIGMSRFGESAPASRLAEEFGFTPSAVATRVAEYLANR
jgi:transketolase